MAPLWATALKLVPWGEVIEATPKLVQAARALLKKDTPGATTTALAPSADSPEPLAVQLAQLQQAHQQSLRLLEQLTEQHAALVRTVDELKRRQRRLRLVVGALALAGLVALVWLARASG